MMNQVCYWFWLRYLKTVVFWLILWVFLFTPFTLYEFQEFAKWKTVLRYIFAVSFIGIEYVVVELKLFNVSCVDSPSWNGPLWDFYLPIFPQLLLDLAKILTIGSPIRYTHCLKNPSKYWNLAQMKRTESLQFWSILGPNLLLGNQKYCEIRRKQNPALLGIWNNVSPRTQKNYRILEKLSKKK